MRGDIPAAVIALSSSSGQEGWAAADFPACRGAQIAIEELAADTSMPVRLDAKMFDGMGTAAVVERMAREIVADPEIVAVVGPMDSAEALVNAPIFHDAGLLQISPCASHPALCGSGFATFTRLVANDDLQGRELARMAHDYLGSRRAAVVHASDVWASGVSDVFERAFEMLGGVVVERRSVAEGSPALPDDLSAIVRARPDLVFFAIHPQQGPVVSVPLRGAGLRVSFLGTDAMKASFPLGGGEVGREAYHTHSGADFRQGDAAARFRAAYTARYPEDSTYSPEGYDAVMLIAEALRRVRVPDRRRILDAVRALREFPGVSGPITFTETGERLNAGIGFYRVRGHKDGGREMEFLGRTADFVGQTAQIRRRRG
jgi:branched-chain amino acid transport system substrate-binding protein